jgi:hypothetical protein
MKRIIKETMQNLPPLWLILPRGGVACTLSASETRKNENQEGNPRGFSRREFPVSMMKCACTTVVSATRMTTDRVVSIIMRSESIKASRTERHFLPDNWVLWVHLERLSCWRISGRWGSINGTARSSRAEERRKLRTHFWCDRISDSPSILRAISSLRFCSVCETWSLRPKKGTLKMLQSKELGIRRGSEEEREIFSEIVLNKERYNFYRFFFYPAFTTIYEFEPPHCVEVPRSHTRTHHSR